jgi:hypothetical protein
MQPTFYQPDRDASLGLIFRLNALWEKADRRALSGDHDEWELVLDRIFSNLLYREEIITEENEEGKVVDVKLSEKDKKVWEKIKEKIRQAKADKNNSLKHNSKLYNQMKNKHYEAIMFYDIWLRKFMQSLGQLYLKEVEHNPSKALFGGAFERKK